MAINADLIVASETAVFGLPEVKRGVVAIAGALPRLIRTVGRQRAMEMVLLGRSIGADEARSWGMVNRVVAEGEAVEEAVKMAEQIASGSPDSIIVSRAGVMAGWDGLGAEEGTEAVVKGLYKNMEGGENMKEGVKSFVEKRKPRWVASKL